MKIIADGAWAQFLTSDGLPASNPPWGYISKLDLVSGKILWNVPVGDINVNGKKVKNTYIIAPKCILLLYFK